ncbi:MAG: magnesium/cobalt transporter CorA [Sulfurimonas sp.]|jgi:magnesium transporter|nr:magnesium/cobalt transporter CorA [Sulfurimonadaceae bacterium]
MVSFYIVEDKKLKIIKELSYFDSNKEAKESVIWIDMLHPTIAEKHSVENLFNLVFPTKEESEEIEISSRYWEEGHKIEINSYFLVLGEMARNETVSFVLQQNRLISIRYAELKTFDEMTKKFLASPKGIVDGYDVFSNILDIRIDADADVIEKLSRDAAQLRKLVFTDYKNDDEEILEKISAFEDLNMKIRENLTDKQRILSAFIKSKKLKDNLRENILVMLKDIRSLIDYTEFNFERLDYLQNAFIGMLSVEQNKVIKIFTVVNVIFLPPTLIASIYGMNFDIMPELHWDYGYVFSFLLMIASATLPLYIFKRKGWF